MKRLLSIIFSALCASSYAQTGITVIADTNRAIRTNFSLVRSQVSDLSGASFAISNITGLQTALDGKLATNGTLAISNITSLQSSLDGKLATNGSASALTNFPALVLQTNSSESVFPQALLRTNGSAAGLSSFPAVVLQTNSSLSAFPQGLLRTNGDGSALTNLPNANLSNAIGVLPLSNGGTGSTNQSSARTALGLGSAATNNASAFQPASTALTNLAAGDASGLTNLPNANLGTATGVLGIANGGSGATNADVARTNFGLAWIGLTNADAAGFRTALSLGTAATNDATAFQPASANLTNLAANNGGSLTNVSVDLTAVLPSYSNNAGKVLAVATGATNVEWTAISNTVTDASLLTNFPSYILQTNSADGSFPSFLLRTNGSAAGLTSFPAIVLQTNSSESVFPQALLRTNGDGGGITNLTAANVVGTVALASNVTGTVALATNVSGTVAVANGGTGGTTASNARINLLPSYTGNQLKVLALNSNATDVIWATDGGVADMSNATNTLAIANGGTGATNATGALTNLGIFTSNSGLFLTTFTASYPNFATVIGVQATNASGGAGNVVLGYQASGSTDGSDLGGVAVGRSAYTDGDGVAVGNKARASAGTAVAIGVSAVATNGVQIGTGTNTTTNTIQFRSAGLVDANEWGALANSSTTGRQVLTNQPLQLNSVLVYRDGSSGIAWYDKNDFFSAIGVYTQSGTNDTNASIQLGQAASVDTLYSTNNGSIAIGKLSIIQSNSQYAIGLGYGSRVSNSTASVAIGQDAFVGGTNITDNYSVAVGYDAKVRNAGYAVQLAAGTNSTDYTIQFFNAGTVNTNEWAALANASTIGTNLMRSTATWLTNTTESGFRAGIGLPLAALTNTSNVTAMRSLSGSTNTNHPFSGTISVVGTNNTNVLVFSNGILQEVQ